MKELLEKGWCQNTEARDVRHEPASATSRAAVEFCIVGASNRVARDRGYSRADMVRFQLPADNAIATAIIRRMGLKASTDPQSIDRAEWNDRRQVTKEVVKEVVLDVVSEAIAILRDTGAGSATVTPAKELAPVA